MATNYEHYKKEIEDCGVTTFVLTKNNQIAKCDDIDCEECKFCYSLGCRIKTLEWLFQEYQEPIIMNETTCHVVLALPDNEYVCRDHCGTVTIHTSEPEKGEHSIRWWVSESGGNSIWAGLFKEPIFEFIQWEDAKAWPTNDLKKIAREQLKNYE